MRPKWYHILGLCTASTLIVLSCIVPWYCTYIITRELVGNYGAYWDISSYNSSHFVAVGITGDDLGNLSSKSFGVVFFSSYDFKQYISWNWSTYDNYTELRRACVIDIDGNEIPEIAITGRARNDSGFLAELDILFLNGSRESFHWAKWNDSCGLGIAAIGLHNETLIAIVSAHSNETCVIGEIRIFNSSLESITSATWKYEDYTIPRDIAITFIDNGIYLVVGGYTKINNVNFGDVEIFKLNLSDYTLSRHSNLTIGDGMNHYHIYGLYVVETKIYLAGAFYSDNLEFACLWIVDLQSLKIMKEIKYDGAPSRFREVIVDSTGNAVLTGYYGECAIIYDQENSKGVKNEKSIGISLIAINGNILCAGAVSNDRLWIASWRKTSEYNVPLGVIMIAGGLSIITCVVILNDQKRLEKLFKQVRTAI
ncbi:MAG: hypothetical protein QXL15_00670 [Candidatus Korarchaeota archaeon]